MWNGGGGGWGMSGYPGQGGAGGQDVDWAALAQQWIHSNQNSGGQQPPVPGTEKGDGGGEASMDLCDTDDQSQTSSGWEGVTWNHHSQQQQGGWSSGWNQGTNSADWQHQAQMQGWQHSTDSGNGWGMGHMDSGWADSAYGNGSGGWINEQSSGSMYSSKDLSQDQSKSGKRRLPSLMDINTKAPDPYQGLNEDQRKRLPPWIREGLEKMERDKRKKEEEEIRKQRTAEKKAKQRREQEEMLNDDPSNPAKSKFDKSASASDNDSDEEPVLPTKQVKQKAKSRFENVDDMVKEAKVKVAAIEHVPVRFVPPTKSKEEILEEMTMNLRKLMTVILLEVTNEEIGTLCENLYAKEKDKVGKPKLKTLLSGYGSNSDSEEEANSDDDDLETILHKKRKKFHALENDIRDECDKQEANYKHREQKWLADKHSLDMNTSQNSDESTSSDEKYSRSNSRDRKKSKSPSDRNHSRSVSRDRKRTSRSRSKEKNVKKSDKRDKNGKKKSRSPRDSSHDGSSTRSSKRKRRSKSREEKSRSRSRQVYRSKSRSRRDRSRSRSRRRRSRSSTRDKKSSKRSRSRDRRSHSKKRKHRSRSRTRRSRSRDHSYRSRSKSRSKSERHKKNKKSRRRSDS